MEFPDGIISLDSDFAAYYGFTSEHFYQDTYLIGDSFNRQVIIPMVISNYPGAGYSSCAIKKLLQDSISVAIPTPVPLMQEILTAWKFEIIWKEEEGIEYWISPA